VGQIFKKFTLFGCLVLSLGLAALVNAKEHTVLVMGDSLSAGYGMSLKQAWPALLQTKLNDADNKNSWRVINASVSGETTQGGVRRLPGLLAQYQPTWVLLELGANDGLRGYPIKNMTANLAAMVSQSQNIGAEVAILGIQLPPNYGTRYTAPFFDQYAALADRFNTALVPFILEDIAVKPQLMQADGLHPTQAAQPIIVDNVWRHLGRFWLP